MSNARPRILCVDDDAAFRGSLAEALADSGFAVRCAGSAKEGVNAFLEGPCDLAVIDLELPDEDGLSLCRSLKSLAGDAFLPIVFLTGRADAPTMRRIFEQGADDVCMKPFSIEELVARMRVLLRFQERERRLAHETGVLQRVALVDPLTELPNRRAFEGDLEKAWARMTRGGRPLALLLGDVDRFKAFNDRFGHAAGDEVLREVARVMSGAIRAGDSAYRIGGEEFAVILPETALEGALGVAERVRRAVALHARPSSAGSRLAVTISIGVATAPDPTLTTRAALIEAADRALYEAKAAGRDRVSTSLLSSAA